MASKAGKFKNGNESPSGMHDIFSHKIAVLGLGYVGLPVALAFGKKFDVVGFDIDKDRISSLLLGYDKNLEFSKDEIFESTRLKFTNEQTDLVDCCVYIVTVPTPVDDVNRPDFAALKSACAIVGSRLKQGDLIIFESTVYPGATEEICVPILEEVSGLKFNDGFSCGYSPERINPGDKINTFNTVTKITSGSNKEAAIFVNELYRSVIEAGTFLADSIKVAEAAKVIENTQRDINIALVNELSVICERLDIDTISVLEAAGSKWNFLPFRPGLVGGHCIGVDPYYLTHKAQQIGYNPQVILSGRRINDNMAKYAARLVIKRLAQIKVELRNARIRVLGLTFKENCPDLRNSKVFNLIDELCDWGISVDISDPFVSEDNAPERYKQFLIDADKMADYDAVIFAVAHDCYKQMSICELEKKFYRGKPIVFADLKAIFNKQLLSKLGFDVIRL